MTVKGAVREPRTRSLFNTIRGLTVEILTDGGAFINGIAATVDKNCLRSIFILFDLKSELVSDHRVFRCDLIVE